jgi:hypothetical protein
LFHEFVAGLMGGLVFVFAVKKKRKKVEVPQEKNLIFSILGAKVESRLGWNLYSTVQGPENLRENLIIR